MADTLGSLSNLLRKTKLTSQAEINAIKHAFLEKSPEQKGIDKKARITKIREKLLLTEAWTTGSPDVDISESLQVRNGNFIVQTDNSSHSAYPVTHTETGTINWSPKNGTKYGALGKFDGTQYVTIPNHTNLDLTLPSSFAFMYRYDGLSGGTFSVFCKKNEEVDLVEDFDATSFQASSFATVPLNNSNAGIHIWIETKQTISFHSTDFDSSFQKATADATINVLVGDGTVFVKASEDSTDLFDGNWHTIIINLGDVIADFDASFQASSFSTSATANISIYQDNSLLGSTDISTITGSITNSRAAYIGGRDDAGTIDWKLAGSLAWFFWESAEQSSADIADYENGVFISHAEKSAISFEGSVENTTLDNF